MRITHTILSWVFVLIIPLMLVSAVAKVEMQYLPFYQYQYEKNYISEITGFSNEELMLITRHLIQFFNNKVESAQLMVEKDDKPFYLFHDYEIEHLNDVKTLFHSVSQVLITTLSYFIAYLIFTMISRNKNRWYYFWKGLRNGNILTLVLLIALGAAVFFGFNNIFIKFHYLVFGDPASSPWILDARTDYLIMMYPLNFWQDAVVLGIAVIIIASLLLALISSLLLPAYHRRSSSYYR